MRLLSGFFAFLSLASCVLAVAEGTVFLNFHMLLICLEPVDEFYVCSAGDANAIGVYKAGSEMDGVPTYTNNNDLTFFRNRGFWYLGSLTTWPPETHYRCVDSVGCTNGESIPPDSLVGRWTVNKKFGKEPLPQISFSPCDSAKDDL